MATALAIVETQPAGFDTWLATCRGLLVQREEINWAIGDHLAVGVEQFGNQLAFDLLGQELGVAPKRLKSAVRVSKAYPPSLRSSELSFAVYEEIARLDEGNRLPVLKRAAVERWNEKTAHNHVEQLRIAKGEILVDDDAVDKMATEFKRMWNRMPNPETREYAFALIEPAARNGFGPINEAEF